MPKAKAKPVQKDRPYKSKYVCPNLEDFKTFLLGSYSFEPPPGWLESLTQTERVMAYDYWADDIARASDNVLTKPRPRPVFMPECFPGTIPKWQQKYVCRHTENVTRFCSALLRALAMNERGIHTKTLMNLKTGKETGTMVIFKNAETGPRGVLLNFCPWCGSSLNTKWRREKP